LGFGRWRLNPYPLILLQKDRPLDDGPLRLGIITVPEFLTQRFKAPEALIIFVFLIVYNVSILEEMGPIFEVLMEIPYLYGLLLSGLVIVFYVDT
jgi:Na+/proline symporter